MTLVLQRRKGENVWGRKTTRQVWVALDEDNRVISQGRSREGARRNM